MKRRGRLVGALAIAGLLCVVWFACAGQGNNEYAFLNRFQPERSVDDDGDHGMVETKMTFPVETAPQVEAALGQVLPSRGWRAKWKSPNGTVLRWERGYFENSIDFFDGETVDEPATQALKPSWCIVTINRERTWFEEELHAFKRILSRT